MDRALEIILPLRNPTPVVSQTIQSLIAQTDRRFTVLISDNHSTTGAELIAAGLAQLRAAGISARRAQPPMELGRVEHWNWAHYESGAAWLKPLFAGDWLEPAYVAQLRRGLASYPDCRYIFCGYVLHLGQSPPTTMAGGWSGRFYPAAEMRKTVLSYGMQFGPPSAAAFERSAFACAGGYPTPLPICADSLLYCTLAARFGALSLAEPLCHFNIHDARFSTTLPGRRRDTFRETFTYCWMLGYRAWSERIHFPRVAFARLLYRETRNYFAAK